MKIRFLLLVCLACSIAHAQESRDPTRPPVTTQSGVPALGTDDPSQVTQTGGIPDVVVSAIFFSDDHRFAIIDNSMVAEGETWNNVLLTKVNKDSIELESGDYRRVVKVFNANIAEERVYVY